MLSAWAIAFASGAIIFFLLYFVASSFNYKKRFNDKYDLKNHFPYEFNYEGHFSDNIIGNVSLIMSAAFSIGLYIVSCAFKYTNGLVIASLGSGVALSLLIVALNFAPLKYLKLHLFFMVLSFVAAFATPALIGFGFFNHYQDFKDGFSLVFFIICLVIAVFLFVLIMNPKLSLNIPMKKATDDKGNEYYVRPKFIVIAFSEWMMIFSILISNILMLILLQVI